MSGIRCVKLTALAAALALAGRTVTRVAPPPLVQPPAQFKEAGPWQRAAAPPPAVVPDAWWTLFGDPVLDDLEQRLVVGNESLKQSAARVANARALLAAAAVAWLPTASIGVSAARSGGGANGSGSSTGNSVSIVASASWEIDLWGRLALGLESARATLDATEADLAAARLSAQALLAQTYFSLRTAEAQQALYARSVQAYQRSLELTQARYDQGVVARADVLQAQTQLKTAQAQASSARGSRAQLEHAIAVLLGIAPSTLTLATNDRLPDPPAVPELLPSTLLERRPDIAAAQRRVVAAYAEIGVADAAFFPSLVLSGSAGWRGFALANLISAPNLFWSIGPALTQALLDGGQRRLAAAQARANADLATSTYRETVLGALQEVEDNLILATTLQEQAQLRREALDSAQRSVQITLDQYRSGTVSYLNVVVAQNDALSSENALLLVRNQQLAALNQLLKNIAGRWPEAGAAALTPRG